ncbi:hypothetical protein BDV96DRAFT_647755 [Lophiotrema nucula]|uniref:Uncharacterized protein n=1 Tax=Lophiotrema nucula TaxID=690887 RepID=A0A6A5Z479_9PLEO|nr:hypothetical protein BDV96DRAFT_647755 [Lophiotrema nucula]
MSRKDIHIDPLQTFEIQPVASKSETFLQPSGQKKAHRLFNVSRMRKDNAVDAKFRVPLYCIDIGSVSRLPWSNAQTVSTFEDAFHPGLPSWVSSGLGHGVWRDAWLEDGLGVEKEKMGNAVETRWKAAGPERRIVWERKGCLESSNLILKPQKTILAVYKPRNAVWARDGKLTEGDGEEEGRNGLGTGMLGICDERLLAGVDADGKNDALRHVLLSGIAIEEQMLKSKGFKPEFYHGHWM